MGNIHRKIFIVEDDLDSLNAMGAILEARGNSIYSFSSPKEALEALKASVNDPLKIDVFFLDVMMPFMNGYELLEEIKKIDVYADVPVFMVTARDKDSDTLEGYSKGADYYITKPFTSKQIYYGIELFFSEKGS